METIDLIGKTVRINIKEPKTYTNDLFKSIQGTIGKIIQKQNSLSSYRNAWLVEFDNKTTRKYAKTSNGKWSATNLKRKMAWWTEKEDFEVMAVS